MIQMKARGVDSFYSWLVALSCGIVFSVISLPIRLGSLLFVEMIDRYDTNRRNASLPFALAYLMRSISGPFAGYFGDKFGLQRMTMFGCVLSFVGVGFCVFSEEIISINIFLGLIYGSGFGWSTCLVPEIINQHFSKHRAKGYGVVLGISGLLSFITPLLLEKIINDYGVSGSFLILSAIILNSVPAAMLIVKPEEHNKRLLEIKSLVRDDEKDSSTLVPLHYIPNSNLEFERVSNAKKSFERSPGDAHNDSFVALPSISNFGGPGPSVDRSTPINKRKHFEQYRGNIAMQVELREESVTSLIDKKLTEKNDLQLIWENRGRKLTEVNDLVEGREIKLAEENDLLHAIESGTLENGFTEGRDRKLAEENDLPLRIENRAEKLSKENDLIESRDCKLAEENDLHSRNRKLAEESDLDKGKNRRLAEENNMLPITENRNRKLVKENDLDIMASRDIKLKEVNLHRLENIDNRLTKKWNTSFNKGENKQLAKTKYKTIAVLWSPVFLLITFIHSSYFYVVYIFWTILVDLVRDKNIPHHLEVYFVVAQTLLDTIGRSALGFVTDNRYMSVKNYSALCSGLMGFSCALLVWVSGFPMTMTTICVIGFVCGANLTVLPGIVTEFIEEEKRTMAMASRLVLYAPMSFTMSPLIGYFRGTLGAYDGLLYAMAVLCASCSIALMLLPRLKKHMESKRKESNTMKTHD